VCERLFLFLEKELPDRVEGLAPLTAAAWPPVVDDAT